MQKHRREKKTVKVLSKKTLLAAFAGLCVLAAGLVASCSNLGAGYDGSTNGAQNAGVQAAEGVLVAKVAMPNMPSIKRQKGGSPKSAFPGLLQAAGSAFSFEATLSSAAATYSTSGTFDDTTSTCDFAFAGALSDAARTYTLLVQLYHKSGLGAEKKLVASGSQTVTVDGGDTSFAANVSLLPNTDAAAPKGSVGLSIKFSDATSVTNLTVQFKDSAGTDWADDYLDGGSTVNLTGGAGTISSAADKIPAGSYTLLMTFNKVTAEGTMVVGSRTESVNVYPAMETNSWWTNGAPTETLDISKNEQTEFWVKGMGGKFYTELYTAAPEAKDTNIGSFAAPLATIQAAVDRIKTIGNTTTQYTIYIDGKVTGDADANYGSAKNFALVNVTGEREILFKGWTGPDKDIIDVNKYDGSSKPLYPGHAFAIATESKITLQNLCLTKASGDATDGSSNGGAIFVGASSADADVTIINSKISGNLAVNGGGIAISKGKVLLKQCVVTDNEASSNGGGIYASGSTVDRPSFTIEDSEISFNKATGTGSSSGGGGLYVGNYAKAYFKSGLVGSDDSANGNTGKYGGGVYVNSNGKFYMSGSSRVGGNTASSNGGGIYNGGTVYMSGSAIVGADPSSLTDIAKKEAAQEADGKHSNMAYAGGGIYTSSPAGIKLGWVDESNPDTAFAGGIYYNCAKSSSGGGVYSNSVSGKTFDLERGSVCYNGAKGYGGGICVYFSGTTGSQITMTGGEVSCNSAKDGGGVYAFDASISGGTIAGNTASNCGGGVYASQEFYLYGTGVIGDDGAHEVAEADDCSNKAKAGGGVYAHKVYIGYSGASTPAACTGGIYRNYATAVKGSETYFYGGGGICVRGTSADWLFKMQSGTVAYNAGDSSDGYGGGLFIYGSGAPDSSIAYPEATGGSFVGNGAKYGGAVCCYSRTLGLGGSIYMPSVTGENGDNDIYLHGAFLHLLSNFDSATPTPVVTITPPAYSIGQKIFEEDDALLPTNCEKVAIASDGSGAPWAVSNKGLLVKDCAECYISATDGGDDTSHDGSLSKPYATIRYAVSQFSNKTAPLGGTTYNPTFKNRIYVLTDYTFTDGPGANDICYFELVGAGGTGHDQPVQFIFNTPTEDHSGIYIKPGQIVKFTNINFTQDATVTQPNAYSAIIVPVGGEAYLEDCSITGIRAQKCSAIGAEGDVHLKNVSIKNNTAIAPSDGGYVWGPAVFSKQGKISLLGKIEITGNMMEIPGALKEQNVWIGDNKDGTVYFEPLVIAGKLATGTSIGVTTYDISATEFTTGYKAAGNTAEPSDYFTSDSGMGVEWDLTSKEAELTIPTTIYVSSSTVTPAGSNASGNGTAAKPFATLQKALNVLDGYGVAANNYTIIVDGEVLGASSIKSGINATKITVQGKTGADSDKLKGSSTAAVLIINDTVPVDMSDLTITGGQRGLFIGAASTVTMTDCVVTQNNATGSSNIAGAGIYVPEDSSITPTLTITGGEVSNNTATGLGGGIHFGAGSLTIEGLTISGNKAMTSGKSGGGLYVGGNNGYVSGFTMTGGQISGNNSYTDGGGTVISCKQSAYALLDGVTISGNTANNGNGGGVAVISSKYLSVKDCVISGNTSTSGNGGGIYNNGTCYIYGSTAIGDEGAAAPAQVGTGRHSNFAGGKGGGIYSAGNLKLGVNSSGTEVSLTGGVYYNFALIGGGIYNSSGTVTMSTGNINFNGATNGAGGVYNNATFNFNNGLIDHNDAPAGAGVYTASSASFTMAGGTISNNTADTTAGSGGGVCAIGTFSMTGGIIIGNSALLGGGIYSSATTASMTAGTLSGNNARDGAGLYVYDGTFTMSGGSISGNTASNGGGGVAVSAYMDSGTAVIGTFKMSAGSISANTAVYGGAALVTSVLDSSNVNHDAIFTISGSASIPVGTGTNKNDVYLQAPITIGGSLTATAPVATITPTIYNTAAQVLIDGAGTVAANYTKFAVTPNGAEMWTIDENGYLKTGGGTGTITFDTPDGKLTLSADKTSITTSASATKITITAKNASGTTISSGLTSWGISVYYGTYEIGTATTNSYTFATSYPKGTYRMVVSVTYNGATYSDAINITKTVD